MYISVFGKTFGKNEFIQIFKSNTIIVTIGVLIGAFFGYVLQFLLARLLSVSDYGTFNAMLSLTYLIGVPTSVLTASIIKISSELLAQKKWSNITKLFLKLNIFLFILGFILFLIIFIFKNFISNLLNISDANLFIPFGLFLGFSYILIVPGAYLQGLLRFKAYAFFTVVQSFLRTLIPTIFVLLGFGLYGVFNGFWVTSIISFLVALALLNKNIKKSDLFKYIDLKDNYKRILSFSSSVIFINFGLMSLGNLDMIMVKRFFSQEIAGYYAGTLTLGKILLFGAGTVSAVMYPQISSLYVEKSKYLYSKFKQFFLIQVFFVVIGFLVFSVFPDLLTKIFFGSRFIDSIKYLPLFSLFISLYILVNFMVLFFMAVDRTIVFIFLIVAALIQFILLNIFNQTIFSVIYVNIFVTFLLLISLLFFYFNEHKEIFKNL